MNQQSRFLNQQTLMDWLPVACHLPWNWRVRNGTVHNLVGNPFASCSSVVDTIPDNPSGWIFAGSTRWYFFATHGFPCSASKVPVVIVLPTMATTCSQRFIKPCSWLSTHIYLSLRNSAIVLYWIGIAV
jgi:hypothetical protein